MPAPRRPKAKITTPFVNSPAGQRMLRRIRRLEATPRRPAKKSARL